MKYAPEIYAQAFIEAIKNKPKEEIKGIIQRFILVIKKNGDFNRWESILKIIQKKLTQAQGKNIVLIEFARRPSEKLLNLFDKKDYLEISIRPSLIAGVRLLLNEEKELDLSLQKKLNHLFKD